MEFSLERLFVDVFAPRRGERVTIMYDLPRHQVPDTAGWQDARQMAEDWQRGIEAFAPKYGITLLPIVTYAATGGQGRELPEHGEQAGRRISLEDVARESTIIIAMPEWSSTAALIGWTKKYANLRAASMPGVRRAMQETGLAADYKRLAETCGKLVPLFDRAEAIEVVFSTGDACTFDTSDHKRPHSDDGSLHPDAPKDSSRVTNLPAGEVFVVPNEAPDSKTAGRIPVGTENEMRFFVIQNNQIVDVEGDGPLAAKMRADIRSERAVRNLAEVAIGCNEKAVVTGNVLEDEKAGFHWAYGLSQHLGGTVAMKDFSGPEKVVHQDVVYAKGNPVLCARLDFLFSDGTRQTVIRDGALNLPGG